MSVERGGNLPEDSGYMLGGKVRNRYLKLITLDMPIVDIHDSTGSANVKLMTVLQRSIQC